MSAFGMGVDIPDIRCIVHIDWPFSILVGEQHQLFPPLKVASTFTFDRGCSLKTNMLLFLPQICANLSKNKKKV
jgi:hypothetical protein